MSARILVVEDEPAIALLIEVNLRSAGFTAHVCGDAESAWRWTRETLPDVILVDWMLPGMSGFQFVRQLRADGRSREVPLIMLTARTDEVDKIAALEAGVDDYVTKPFSPKELVARVKAVLRRRDPQMFDETVEVGELRLVPVTRKVTVKGEALVLGPTEFRLLHFFMTHCERVHSRSQLLDHVWGGRSFIDERTVDVHIRRLRSVLEDHALDAMVQTVRGVGYRFSSRPAEA